MTSKKIPQNDATNAGLLYWVDNAAIHNEVSLEDAVRYFTEKYAAAVELGRKMRAGEVIRYRFETSHHQWDWKTATPEEWIQMTLQGRTSNLVVERPRDNSPIPPAPAPKPTIPPPPVVRRNK